MLPRPQLVPLTRNKYARLKMPYRSLAGIPSPEMRMLLEGGLI